MTHKFRIAIYAVLGAGVVLALAAGYRLLHRPAAPPVASASADTAPPAPVPVPPAPAPAPVEVSNPAEPPGEFGVGNVSGGDGVEPGRIDCTLAAKVGKRLPDCRNTWTPVEREQYTALEAALATGKSPGDKGKASVWYEPTRGEWAWFGSPIGDNETEADYLLRLIRERGAVIAEAAWEEPRCQEYIRLDNGTRWIDRFGALVELSLDPSKGAAYAIDFCKRKTPPPLPKNMGVLPFGMGGEGPDPNEATNPR